MSPRGRMAQGVARWRNGIDAVCARCAALWAARSQREKRLLLAMAAVLLAAVLWTLALSPALRTIERAQAGLPGLQARAAQLDAVIREAQALGQVRRGQLSAAEAGEALAASLRGAGLDAGLAAQGPGADSDAVAQWRIRFDDAPAAQVLEWLAGLPDIASLRVLELDLGRSLVAGRERPGRLSGEILLVLAEAA